jgi:putative transposase
VVLLAWLPLVHAGHGSRHDPFINARARWTGHLFQGRFGSAVMDEAHLIAAARYIALNPVRARLVARPQDWDWSSARAHLAGRDNELVKVGRCCNGSALRST